MYKGGSGQWAYILHRVTGVGVFLFLLIHIVDTALIGWGPEIYNKAMDIYRMPIFKLGEIALFAAVLFHAINGTRIVIFDFWVGAMRFQKQMFWIGAVIFVAAFIPVAWIMLGHMMH